MKCRGNRHCMLAKHIIIIRIMNNTANPASEALFTSSIQLSRLHRQELKGRPGQGDGGCMGSIKPFWKSTQPRMCLI